MRAALWGRQVVLDRQGNFVACNIGYNFYAEHEYGVQNLVHGLNENLKGLANKILSEGYYGLRAELKMINEVKKAKKKMTKWKNTPFSEYVLNPNIPILVKKVKIDNTTLYDKYSNFILENDDYIMIYADVNYEYIEKAKEKLGKKRIFNEADFIYMRDYNTDMNCNPGYILGKDSALNCNREASFVGSWADDGFMIFIKRNGDIGEKHVDNILKALHNGNLALIDKEPRLFRDNGLCLIDLEAAYRPRIN